MNSLFYGMTHALCLNYVPKIILGEQTDIGFQAKLEGEDKPPKAFIKFNGRLIYNELDPNFVLDFEAPPPKLTATIPSASDSDNSTNSGEETKITLDFVPGLRDELKEKDEIPDKGSSFMTHKVLKWKIKFLFH